MRKVSRRGIPEVNQGGGNEPAEDGVGGCRHDGEDSLAETDMVLPRRYCEHESLEELVKTWDLIQERQGGPPEIPSLTSSGDANAAAGRTACRMRAALRAARRFSSLFPDAAAHWSHMEI